MWAANPDNPRSHPTVDKGANAVIEDETTPVIVARLRANRRRRLEGQSLVVAIIVLFLLLFLGGLFIALIANNLRNTRRGTQVSAADKFAEAGIRYLDQQLMTSGEGADWRPSPSGIFDPGDLQDVDGDAIPDPVAVDVNGNGVTNVQASQRDPDFFWIQLPRSATGVGGFTRLNFGGPTPSQGNLGGRALVRVTYRPNLPGAAVGSPLNKYLRLESVGRAGVVDPLDPTTYRNSEGLGLRRELLAYKAIGITDYINWITNKDNRSSPMPLGAPTRVQDRPANVAGDPPGPGVTGTDLNADGTLDIVDRFIPSVYLGPVRVNGDVVFYGANYFGLDSLRNDAIEVSGSIRLNGLAPNATLASLTPTDPTKVLVSDIRAGAPPPLPAFITGGSGNLVPSASVDFSTFAGLVRDNPRGNETQGLSDLANNPNLRAAPRLEPPVIDAPIGDRGLTRYRLLTRNSPRLADRHVLPGQIGLAPAVAGAYGWGQNLYVANSIDLQTVSENVSNASSLRAEWLNPDSPGKTTGTGASWIGGQVYQPPAVTIELFPRYMRITRSANQRSRQYMRLPGDGRPVNPNQSTIVRYTYEQGGPLAGAPQVTLDDGTAATDLLKYAGYPATRDGVDGVPGTADDTPYYQGDFVVFAEGNVRIKGVAGGLDPETGQAFVRNLTVVSNGTVYVDGNLLRDNIPSDATAAALVAARGRSSVALLAKEYVTVNTTQFLAPVAPTSTKAEQNNEAPPYSFLLQANSAGNEEYRFGFMNAPVMQYDPATGLPLTGTADLNVVPPYASPATFTQQILFRHASENDQTTAINLFVNESALGTTNNFDFNAGTTTYVLQDSTATPGLKFRDDRFILNPSFLFPQNTYPYAAAPPALGTKNRLTVRVDGSSGDAINNYMMTRVGIVPLDIRIEAVMYAQEGSFFIIPGPWFNPDPNDTYERYMTPDDPARPNPNFGRRAGEESGTATRRINPRWPFYQEPLDVRITFIGAIAQNLPAEIGDQGAWLEKWGWVPRYQGSTGLPSAAGYPAQDALEPTEHGPGTARAAFHGPTGNGIQFIYDPRAASPYVETAPGSNVYVPIRRHPYLLTDPLPLTPRLPVAPGLLYFGERPSR